MDEKDKAQDLYQQRLEVAITQNCFADKAESSSTSSATGQTPSLKVIQ